MKTMKNKIQVWLYDYNVNNDYFCLCGCSPFWWNVKQFLLTTWDKITGNGENWRGQQ